MRPAELAGRLAKIRQDGLLRQRRLLQSPQGAEVVVDGKPLLNFCSNDYLGLANHPGVIAAFRQGLDRYGSGSGASHLVCGHGIAHHALEEELADFTGRQRALLFSSGYMANLGVIAALAHRGSVVFEDRLNHASLIDGGLLSGARFKRYAHADADDLSLALERFSGEEAMIVTDGVFSMDGDVAPLPQLAAAAAKADAWLMVDDAHGFGVLGANGGGVAEHFGLAQPQLPILVGTLGKAFGSFGAFVAGSADLIEFLLQAARSYVFTTALPPAVAEATRASLSLLRGESWRREKLRGLIERFRNGAEQLGLGLMASQTSIQPIVIGDNEAAMEASRLLLRSGILVGAIRPPTVPVGTARLRITLSAAHQDAHVDRLLDALSALQVS